MLASAVMGRAAKILNDEGYVTYTSAELLDWLNDGQREVVILRPDANQKNQAIQLTAGDIKQTLPADAIRLTAITRNMGADGATPGRPVYPVTRDTLDAQVPTWTIDAAAAAIEHFLYSPMDRTRFYVYPKPAAAIWVEAVYSAAPATIASANDAIGLDDIYVNALVDYQCYRAFAKDSEFPSSAQRAAAHYQAFQVALGVSGANG